MKYSKYKRYNPRKHIFLNYLLLTHKKRIIRKKELVYDMKIQKLQDIIDALSGWVEAAEIERNLKHAFLHDLEMFRKFLLTFLTRSTLNSINYYTLKAWESRIDTLANEISRRKNPFFKLLYSRFKLSLDEFYRELGIR
ncbi:hypothetical protein VFC49_04635 [Thermococcus sp. SY098]|uniref:hypothetical protein n=1 Tax=Thermococcus sp. SY098 TaxID=3111325 RepID=UPI002D77DECD|nr:hypothetical protein [Thermococcus sp. SY098]WRS53401.1 hypothetical protein VFC49_04635 [Thermococcus sp. SY098]